MNSGPIETPKDKIANAMAVFILAVRIARGFEDDVISKDLATVPIRIETGGPGITIEAYDYPKQVLVDQSFNLLLIALGGTALIVDEALDQNFGAKDATDASGIGGARNIIYQIRNAFAHNPLNPRWKIKGHYQRPYKVELGPLVAMLNGKAVDGMELTLADFGGLEAYIALLKFCHEQVTL